MASCGITCWSILFIWQIGKYFLWVRSCWFHQHLRLRTCSQGICSHIYTHSCGSCWGKLVTTLFKKPYRQNKEEAQLQFAFLTAWKRSHQHCLLKKSDQHCSSVSRPAPFEQQPGTGKKQNKTKKEVKRDWQCCHPRWFFDFCFSCGDRQMWIWTGMELENIVIWWLAIFMSANRILILIFI